MSLPPIDSSRDPELVLGDMLAYVEQADALVNARDMVSLAGFDLVVDALCERVLALDPVVAKHYAPQLEHLRERLNSLQKKMILLQGEVKTTIASLSSTKKANLAYNHAPTGKVDT